MSKVRGTKNARHDGVGGELYQTRTKERVYAESGAGGVSLAVFIALFGTHSPSWWWLGYRRKYTSCGFLRRALTGV